MFDILKKGELKMPNIKSAEKRVKVIATKTLRNQMIKSNLKTTLKSFDACAEGADKAKITESYKKTVKTVDQATAKGILHKNTAARKKSTLAKKYAEALKG